MEGSPLAALSWAALRPRAHARTGATFQPKEWTVQVSKDDENWEVVAHGPGDPALRTIDLAQYVPGKLWLRLKGDNVELYSVLLETVSGDGE